MKKVLAFIWAVVFAHAIFTFGNYFIESNNNRRIYQELGSAYIESSNYTDFQDTYMEEKFYARYSHLLSLNQEIVGWIRLPNTMINYPVVKADNNQFYLKHNFYKEPSKAGAIFMDFRNEPAAKEKHKIIYGHHMKDGSMFGDLKKYRTADFLYENPIIEFNTLYEDIKWEIFSVYVTGVDFYYIKTDYSDKEDYRSFIESISEKSIFRIDTEVTEEDQILTLSTCSYEFEDARFVIHAKRIN